VWLHGCGGDAQGDTYEVAPGDDRSYIAISVGGRDGGCWDPNSDEPKVLAAVADVRTHFAINPRRVIIAGYSSGGDLAYRTIFDNASQFAGILAENTSPFRDTGSTQAQSLAAASWKFNVIHLAHTEDDTYPLDGVTNEINAMKAAGFPVTLIAVPGQHYDPDDDVNGTGTDNDLRRYLLPHINDGWLSP
jgi:dienelactone hydrolase